MRRSKLEVYESILEALVNKPLTLEEIAYESGVDCTLVHQYQKFLQKHELIEERVSGKKTKYALTERGVAVLRALNFQKYLAKIKNSIRAVDEALQIVPLMPEHNEEHEKK
ncbi:MAG: winged helix-turn-helix domain-containing protein [Candidatus Bathyarchaeia archaeon]